MRNHGYIGILLILFFVLPGLAGNANALSRREKPALSGADHYQACLALTQRDAEAAYESAISWRNQGGGYPARHCAALAEIALERFRLGAFHLEELANDMTAQNSELSVEVRAQAGNAWLLANDASRAYQTFSTALESDADNVDLLIDRARSLAEMGSFARAFEDLDHALSLEPERSDALALRAAARRHMGESERALEDAELALAIDPSNLNARLERGILLLNAGRTGDAKADFEEIVRSAPNTPASDAAKTYLAEIAEAE